MTRRLFVQIGILFLVRSNGVFDVVNAQSSTPRVIADVFECDPETLRPLADGDETLPPRVSTHVFNFCIEPNLPTLNRGIVLASVNNFGFLKDETEISQLLIDDGSKVVDPNYTRLDCTRGATTCTVSTTLRPEFFDVTLSDNPKIRGIAEIFFESVEDGTYVGRDNGDIVVDVELVFNPGQQPILSSDGGSSVGSGWNNLPEWARILIIVLGVVVVLCCMLSLVACCFYGCFKSGREAEKRKSLQRARSARSSRIIVIRDSIQARKHPIMPPRRQPSLLPLDNTEYIEEDYDEEEQYKEGEELGQITEDDDEEDEDESNIANDDDDEGDEAREEDFVYFDSEDQPGTKVFNKALRKTVKKYLDKDFSPDVYRYLKKQLPGKTFMIYDYHDEDENVEGEWREMQKKELIKRFKKEFKKEKRRLEKEEK